MKELQMVVGNDNGNSEQDIIIDGMIINSPNVHVKVSKLPNLEQLNEKYVAENIDKNLIVTIASDSLNNGTPTTYYVGEYAIKTGKILKNIEVGALNSKINSDIPLVNTLAHIAGQAVKKSYLEDSEVKEISVKVDMTTGLPITQYDKKNAEIFSDKFMGKEHTVTIYLGTKKVNVKVVFEFVKVLPEGVPSVFYLKDITNGKGKNEHFELIMKTLKVGKEKVSFDNKKILHVGIGEGTTEYPLTVDINFNPHFIRGENHGVGHAINAVLPRFIKENSLAKYARQDFSNALRNHDDRYNSEAVEIIQDELEAQASLILDTVKQEVGKANNDIDFIMVYGGGSILLKEYLEENLMEFANIIGVNVLYIPSELAVNLESLGMYAFSNSKLFKALKQKTLAS